MIGQLRGIILEKQPPLLLLDVNGVGYEIDAPMSTFYRLPDVGQEIILHTHLIVREDAHQLYGFIALDDRNLFRLLISVNGIGPKTALGILSAMDARALAEAIQDEDITRLTHVPGIGKKTAERVILELRGKLKMEGAGKIVGAMESDNDIVEALISLGYTKGQAKEALSKVDSKLTKMEDRIKEALKLLKSK